MEYKILTPENCCNNYNIKLPELFIARGLVLNVARTSGTIRLRKFWKISGLRSYGTSKSKQIGILLVVYLI